jgi:hypothetical protein
MVAFGGAIRSKEELPTTLSRFVKKRRFSTFGFSKKI